MPSQAHVSMEATVVMTLSWCKILGVHPRV
jgi:hypothetical protein